jgi:hypothetical protein
MHLLIEFTLILSFHLRLGPKKYHILLCIPNEFCILATRVAHPVLLEFNTFKYQVKRAKLLTCELRNFLHSPVTSCFIG